MKHKRLSQYINVKNLSKFLNNNNFFKLTKEINKLPTSSWLFVTRNRCPFADPEKNPLIWSFQTLINNKFYQINNFVVIDDHSNDYTKECIDWLQKRYNIKIKYIRNKKRLGCSASRSIGLKHAKNNLVFMGDDDCLYSQYFLVGALFTYQMLQYQNSNEKIAVINFPVYEKSFYPRQTVERERIGKVILSKTFFYHEFDRFPQEYIQSPQYLDKHNLILKPFRVGTFSGVNLSDKKLILQAGNYLDLSMWSSSYSEHIELSYQLQKRGFAIYHQPDPKISCLHLKYGNKTRDQFDKRFYYKKILGLKYNLGQIIDFAERKRRDTGERLSEGVFHIIEIGSFFSFYLKISENLGLRFAKNQYKIFVEDGKVFSTTPLHIIKNKAKRRSVFLEGIKRGIIVTEKQTHKSYHKIWQRILDELTF